MTDKSKVILSVDGGSGSLPGTSYTILCTLCDALREAREATSRKQKPFLDNFDLVVATSTSALPLLTMAYGREQWGLGECQAALLSYFRDPARCDVSGLVGDGFFTKHSNIPNMAVTALEHVPEGALAKPFRNYSTDSSFSVQDVIHGSTATPPQMFPTVVGNHKMIGDARILYSNPLGVALAEAKMLWPEITPLEDCILVSVGMGYGSQVDITSNVSHVSPDHLGVNFQSLAALLGKPVANYFRLNYAVQPAWAGLSAEHALDTLQSLCSNVHRANQLSVSGRPMHDLVKLILDKDDKQSQ